MTHATAPGAKLITKLAFTTTSFTLGTGAGFDYFSDKIWFDLVLMNLRELYQPWDGSAKVLRVAKQRTDS